MVCDHFRPKIVFATADIMEAETMFTSRGIPGTNTVSTPQEPNQISKSQIEPL